MASFFLSRIDVLVDAILENMMQASGLKAALAATLHGQVAIASAKVAYQIYQEIVAGEQFRPLYDRAVRSFSFSNQPIKKRRDACSNIALYGRS